MDDITIRECLNIEELGQCVRLQRHVFGLPDIEISPRRHLIVSREAGGWTLGAFDGQRNGKLVGFVHHLVAVRNRDEIFGYSHMMAVDGDYQNRGVGARLKWAQRERALAEGRSFIKWTWDPMQARNAHFNLNRLGVTVSCYAENFYGTDYPNDPVQSGMPGPGIDSDRLFANWDLASERVTRFAAGTPQPLPEPVVGIGIPPNWSRLVKEDASEARKEQLRVKAEFQSALAAGLICASFQRDDHRPQYLLYESGSLPG
jgi:predicted GNAT superfamily acetyltransferase